MEDYGLVNARLRFVPRWRGVGHPFANNLLDETYATYAQRFGGGFWDAGVGRGPRRRRLVPHWAKCAGRPREVGLTVQYDF